MTKNRTNNIKLLKQGFVAGVIALSLISPLAVGAFSFPDGILIRAEQDEKVYYLEDGKKRWVQSVRAFLAHGFRWSSIVSVTRGGLIEQEEGEELTPTSYVALPRELEVLPDLVPFPVGEFHLSTHPETGRVILKFTSSFWNQGKGPLELIGDPATRGVKGDVERDVLQRIVQTNGTYRDKIVGTFLWHTLHNHYHFADFAEYTFEPLDTGGLAPTLREKTTFCIWDTKPVALNLEGAPRQKVFASCDNKERQGISVGWADIYEYTLPDQYIDVHDMPKGMYRFTLNIDPSKRFVEIEKNNNTSVTFLNLDVTRGIVEVVATGAPFSKAGVSSYPDGMLVRGDGDGQTYIMYRDKKRLLRNTDIFNSYSLSAASIEVLPQSIIDTLPYNNLIRVDGVRVYALNDGGYRRHIRNIDIFDSYGLSWDDIADINNTEFFSYREGNLIRQFGNEKVYYVTLGTKRWIQTDEAFRANNFDWNAIHIVNALDFDSYTMGSDISGFVEIL